MAKTFEFEAFYRSGQEAGLPETVRQWSCRGALAQYRLPYRITLKHVPQGARVLDWGCGNGHFSYFLTRHGLDVTGYSFDSAPPFLAEAPNFDHVPGDASEPTRLPFEDNSFDFVFSMGVLEHVYQTGGEETASLRELRRVTRPGGKFLCFHFPNKFGWIEPVGRALGSAPHFHYRKYTGDDIRRLTREAGWRVEESGRYNLLPRNQLRRLPKAVADAYPGVSVINTVDALLSYPLGFFAQNWYFVARNLAA